MVCTEIVREIRGWPIPTRIERLLPMIKDYSPGPERARLSLILAHALRSVGRADEALAVLQRELACPEADGLRWRLLGLRALIEIDRADDAAAARTVEDMDRYEPDSSWMGEYYGIRARICGLRDDPAALEWSRRAVNWFTEAGNAADAAVYATWAALFAVDRGRPVEEWLTHIPEADPYRLAIDADAAMQAGDAARAVQLAGQVAAAGGDTHARARAKMVLAQAEANPVAALCLAEEALALALADRGGYEPLLVERIRQLQSKLEREVMAS